MAVTLSTVTVLSWSITSAASVGNTVMPLAGSPPTKAITIVCSIVDANGKERYQKPFTYALADSDLDSTVSALVASAQSKAAASELS